MLSQDQLRELVWGDTLATSRDEVKLYVGYLRRKLAPDAPGATPIETVRGFGYRYRPPCLGSGFSGRPRFRPQSSRFPTKDADPGAANNPHGKDMEHAEHPAASGS